MLRAASFRKANAIYRGTTLPLGWGPWIIYLRNSSRVPCSFCRRCYGKWRNKRSLFGFELKLPLSPFYPLRVRLGFQSPFLSFPVLFVAEFLWEEKKAVPLCWPRKKKIRPCFLLLRISRQAPSEKQKDELSSSLHVKLLLWTYIISMLLQGLQCLY